MLNDDSTTSLTKLIEQQKSFIAALPQSSSSSCKDPIKLLKIDIPVFGVLFEYSVKNKDSLTNAMKLQFLKGALKGEAAALIKHLTITDANFTEAWDKLVIRYDKKKQILNEYIRTFMSQPTCNQASQSMLYISSLRKLADTSDQVIRGIKVLGDQASNRDAWLIHIILSKVDSETRKYWAKETAADDFPTYAALIEFINRRCDALEAFDNAPRKYNSTTIRNLHLSASKCAKCKRDHNIFKCPEYKAMNTNQLRQFILTNALCFNCLVTGHTASKCKSNFKCHYCQQSHHSSLHNHESHYATPNTQYRNSSTTNLNGNSTPLNITSQSQPQLSSHTATHGHISQFALLPTALVDIPDASGVLQTCRILIDSGSQATFISEECVQRLRLVRENAKIVVNGLGSSKNAITRGKVSITLISRTTKQQLCAQAYILNKLTTFQPSSPIQLNIQHIFTNYTLTDPNFYIPQKIDIILGADYFIHILQDGKVSESINSPMLQNTIFGYVVAGSLSSNMQIYNMNSFHADIVDLDNTLRQFWELENIPYHSSSYTEDELVCESFFINTHYLDPLTQRYVVRLPFKQNEPQLGQSISIATSCLKSLERRFQQNSKLQESYSEFMEEYMKLGHMELISYKQCNFKPEHMYLPHHAVFKQSSTTTKIRVVFNGSAQISNGMSLNQKLLVGPKTQGDLHQILLRFQTFKIALVADIEKMYRQVLINPIDRHYQRILWRKFPQETIQQYWLNTVTYGTASAPFLATRALNQVAIEFEKQYPLAKHAILNNFYVDDFLGGAKTETEAILLYHELSTALGKRGFTLRKWASNSPKIRNLLQSSVSHSKSKTITENSDNLKVLGLNWLPYNDCFTFEVSWPENSVITKRSILSETSRIFDPLGLISPITIRAKLLLQQLWLKNYECDDPCIDIKEKWIKLRTAFNALHHLHIPRHCDIFSHAIEIHGFADASQYAYAAVVCCRSIDKNNVVTNKNWFAWTDSSVVLSWLSSSPKTWKPFIANRTSEILQALPRSHWNYVPSTENPADLASRGITVKQLLHSSLWWHGCKWLIQDWRNLAIRFKPSEKGNTRCGKTTT